MDGEQPRQDVHAARDGSVAGGDSTVNNNNSPPGSKQMRTEPNASAWARSRKWSLDNKLALAGIVASSILGIAAVAIPLLLTSGGSGGAGQSQVRIHNNYGPVVIGGRIINNYYGSTASSLSNNPQVRIVQLTGSWTEQGFVNAIISRDINIVALYLKSGMQATTIHEGASAILFGFQGDRTQNGDPVALIKTFQANGFKVDDELQDSYLMGALTNNEFPLMFNTDLAPKGYTGGYQDGTFVGSLLFWIVQRSAWAGPTDQDIQVIKYLISQGADCKVPLSFLKYNGPITLAGTSPYEELLPMMQSCAK